MVARSVEQRRSTLIYSISSRNDGTIGSTISTLADCFPTILWAKKVSTVQLVCPYCFELQTDQTMFCNKLCIEKVDELSLQPPRSDECDLAESRPQSRAKVSLNNLTRIVLKRKTVLISHPHHTLESSTQGNFCAWDLKRLEPHEFSQDFYKNRSIEKLPKKEIVTIWCLWPEISGTFDRVVAAVRFCCQLVLVWPFLLLYLQSFFSLFVFRFLHCAAQSIFFFLLCYEYSYLIHRGAISHWHQKTPSPVLQNDILRGVILQKLWLREQSYLRGRASIADYYDWIGWLHILDGGACETESGEGESESGKFTFT